MKDTAVIFQNVDKLHHRKAVSKYKMYNSFNIIYIINYIYLKRIIQILIRKVTNHNFNIKNNLMEKNLKEYKF